MTAVRFIPWIGPKYETEGLRGLRLLIVAESHYGNKHSERPAVTPELVKALGQRMKHPDATERLRKHSHFARIVAAVSGAPSASGLSGKVRADFWNCVCYYNFVQEFVPKPRVPPSEGMWVDGRTAFPEVLAVLQPDVVITFSRRLGRIASELCGAIPLAKVQHPSTGFAYAKWNPAITAAMDEARTRKLTSTNARSAGYESEMFRIWRKMSDDAAPAHGPHLPAELLAETHARWAREIAELDGRRRGAGLLDAAR